MKKSTLSTGDHETKEKTRIKRILASRGYARKNREKMNIYMDDLLTSRNILTKSNNRLALENEKLRQQVILLTKNAQEVINKLSQREVPSNLWTPQLSLQEDHELSVMRGTIKILEPAICVRSNINAFDQMERMGRYTNLFDSDIYNTRDKNISNDHTDYQRQYFNNNNLVSHFDSFAPLQGLIPDNHISNPNGTQQFKGLNSGSYTRASAFKFAGHVSANTPPPLQYIRTVP